MSAEQIGIAIGVAVCLLLWARWEYRWRRDEKAAQRSRMGYRP